MADTTAPAQVVECAASCVVQVVIQPARATQEDYEAAMSLFVAFLVAGSLIFGARRLYELFTSRSES